MSEPAKARREDQELESAPPPARSAGQRGDDDLAAEDRASQMWQQLDAAGAGKSAGGGKQAGKPSALSVEPTHSRALAELLGALAAAERTPGDEVGTYEAEQTGAHDGQGERTLLSVKDTLDLRYGVKLTQEDVVEQGALARAPRSAEAIATERVRVSGAINDAKAELTVQMVVSQFHQTGLTMKAARLEAQADELAAALDPELVEGKRNLLHAEAKSARAEAAAIEEEVQARQRLIATLDEGLADLNAQDDAWEVARDLAAAELEFRGKLKVTRKSSLGLDVVKGAITRERGVTEVATDEQGGTLTTNEHTSTKITAGKGMHGERTSQQGHSIADAEGNVLSAEETTKTRGGGVSLGEDGAVGLTGSSKLSKAIETSHGKTTHSVSCGGGVNVNVIALPRARPGDAQQFSVVVTLNLEAALAFGAEKKKGGKHGTGKLGLDASARLEGQLTHTHILDAAGAATYLAALEQAGAGDKGAAGKAPELSLLQKAITGLETVDDLAATATATVGSPDAAARLGADESVELTLRAGASLDASLGGESADEKSSVGGSLGAARDAYRTLKIAGVAGAPGQELVDVTVMFGDGADQHGALTASALGVSVSAGARQWGKGEQAVTFRLDAAGGEEYRALYSEIVATSSRDALVALRQSPRFRAHVLAYSSKAEAGGETSLGIAGALGVAAKDSWSRSSARGQDEAGELTADEIGTSSTSTGFSVGPLELLRRSQTASAHFESRGGVSTLDLAETTEQTGLGGFEVPTLREVLAAESPLKALEAAVTETRKTLAGFLLDPEDLLAVARRAKDEAAWSRVPIAAGIHALPTDEEYRGWAALRRELVSPTLDAGASLEHLALERELARGRALADFMAETGKAKGVKYLQCVLRDYGAQGGESEDLGLAYEFPEGIKPERFMELRFQLRTIEKKVTSLSPMEGLEACATLEVDTAELLDQLGRADFHSERARLEMIGELRERAIGVASCRRALEREAGLGDNQTSDPAAEAAADARTRVHHREEQVIQSKCAELRLLQRCETVFADDPSSIEVDDQLGPILVEGGQLDEVFEQHVKNIVSLRATYRAAGTPQADWLCSADVHDSARTYDVDMDRALSALWAYYKSKPLRLGESAYEPRRQRWHRNFWSY